MFFRLHKTQISTTAVSLKSSACDSVETTICKWRLLFAGAVQRTNNNSPIGRCLGRWLVGRIRDQANQNRTGSNVLSIVDDLRVIRATERCTESSPLVFGLETVSWLTAKNGGKWYREATAAAEYLMAKWHRGEAESSWLRHAAEDAKSDDCLLYTSPSPRDRQKSRMPSSA